MKTLKEKWEISSNFQLFIILLVFSITGSVAVVIKTYVKFNWIRENNSCSLDILAYSNINYISYLSDININYWRHCLVNLSFFWNFEKKMLSRLGFKQLLEKNRSNYFFIKPPPTTSLPS